MSTIKILDSDARPQPLSPLFTRLPLELRLMIYTFVFMGCQVSFRARMKTGLGWPWQDVEGPVRHVCEYGHIGGGFGLLRTCRMAYIEAFDTYWSEAVLNVRLLRSLGGCKYLPAAIKANVRHIRWAKLPILGYDRSLVEDPYRVPAQLAEFPKLISCAFRSFGFQVQPYVTRAQSLTGDYVLKVPDAEIRARSYEGVGPFQMKSGESPAAFIERTIGVRPSDGVTILSHRVELHSLDFSREYKDRWQFFNWATGMVYQTTTDMVSSPPTAEEDAYQQALRARPGDEWSRSDCVHD